MNYENDFKNLFESITDYRKLVLLVSLTKNDKDLLLEIGFSERDISRLYLELKIFLKEQEEYLDYIKTEEESVIGKILIM